MLVCLAYSGCENTEPSPEQRQEIERVVIAYLHLLADAYSSMDPGLLAEHATGREIAEVREMLVVLASSGDRMQAKLLRADVVDLFVFRGINATVKLLEVWDITRFDAYTGREKGRNPASVQNSIIQLRLIEGEWKVTGRRVLETQSGGAPTPTPFEEHE